MSCVSTTFSEIFEFLPSLVSVNTIIMIRTLAGFSLMLLLGGGALAAPSAADEVLVAFQSRLESGSDDLDDLLATVEELPGSEQKTLAAEIEKIWPRLSQAYIATFNQTAKSLATNRGDARQSIQKHRAEFMRVYALDEGPMKPLLKEVSMPAIEELRKLLTPTSDQVLAAGGAPLLTQRKTIVTLAKFRDGTLNAMLSTTPADSVIKLAAAEQAAAESISGFDRNDLKTLEQNRKIAASKEVPEEEARGIEECNILRMLVGLRALVLDPKLCDASRDHSKDMAEHGFFAHESPVAGKTTPWDRASNFGTTASGENIFAGSSSAHSANMGWFYSPGHHKNMFSPGQVRIGLGNHGNHWTQMFGR
jgi:uncharacterized protein YkwD